MRYLKLKFTFAYFLHLLQEYQEYTDEKQPRNTWTSDQSKAKHFVSGNRYEIGEEDFVESAAAKGQMIVAGLEVGEYVLEEVKAPENG